MPINPTIFKAYDIRGRYPGEINEKVAARVAGAFVVLLNRPKSMVVGRDVRMSGPKLAQAVIGTLRQSGVKVLDIGIVPADAFYFGVVRLRADGGIYISASHNSREWNGMNLCRKNALPISADSGLKEIERLTMARAKPKPRPVGKIIKKNIIDAYLDFVWSLSPIQNKNLRPQKIVVNGNFGVSAKLFKRLVKKHRLPFSLAGLNDQPDGRFPKGQPDPLLKQNQKEMSQLVLRQKADLGISWDADGDRCFFFDERGKIIEGCFTTAILAQEMLQKNPGATIATDPRNILAVREAVKRLDGKFIISQPGMTRFAETMRKTKAVFGGEMSGHFYFQKTFYRDNGFLPVLMMLDLMLKQNKRLSAVAAPFRQRYFISGEINFELPKQEKAKAILSRVERIYRNGKISRIDGLSMEYPNWRFNLRPSNTEPLLRLNVEARNRKTLRQVVRRLSKMIRSS